MSQSQHDSTAGRGAPGGDWWSRRPRRSATDRKIAGVAGGLGRTLGVDPVLMRVGFVVLMIFGVGVPLYLLGWLLLPADGDETSAAESLIGRGRSSVPPVLAVGLAIVLIISMGWMFSWGSPFWPLLVVGIIAVIVARKRRQNCAGQGGPRTITDDWSARVGQRAQSWGEQAEQWVARQSWSDSGSGSGSGSTVTGAGGRRPGEPKSPFENPPFWEQDHRAAAADGPAAAQAPSERTPPAWDPLGVAPFAWDLPEPPPLPAAPPARQTDRGVVGRVTLGVALLVGGLATAGVFAGWWNLSWAAVAASALAVLAVGLLIGSLRGRGMALIGPGIFLSLVTVALTITGVSGTSGYGHQVIVPSTPSEVASEYRFNGGQYELDLSKLEIDAGQTVPTELVVGAGQASVIVPQGTKVDVTCSANAGDVDCLGQSQSGLHKGITTSQPGSSANGTIDLTVHVGAGQVEVTSRG